MMVHKKSMIKSIVEYYVVLRATFLPVFILYCDIIYDNLV